jgi:hypothetical protein
MSPHRADATVDPDGQIVIGAVPYSPGDRVEVWVLPKRRSGDAKADELRSLIRDTRASLGPTPVTEEEIAAEIAAYRSGA